MPAADRKEKKFRILNGKKFQAGHVSVRKSVLNDILQGELEWYRAEAKPLFDKIKIRVSKKETRIFSVSGSNKKMGLT